MAHHSSWRSKLALLAGSLLVCAVLGEVAARAYWSVAYDVPFREPALILYSHYPELRIFDEYRPAHDDDYYDILVLGGSTLHRDFATVVRETHERLAAAGHPAVRIFNLAGLAHTSRDSWLKYASMAEPRFELVIFYHGINDARANNAPEEVFREDYGHYSWYEIVNSLAPFHRRSSLALPQTLTFSFLRLRQSLNEDRYIPIHVPRSDWVGYGRNYRSAASFERNLRAIIELASERGDEMLLMTFATHVPEDYSDEAFRQKRLDYSLHLFGIHHWGRLENVIGAIDAHNEVVRRLAENEQLSFVDQARLMKGSARNFNDPCHLTNLGSHEFTEHLLQVLLPIVDDHD